LSLRARLLIALIGLVAAGLIVVSAVTYAEQRSFLLDRLDQQAEAALEVVSFQLDVTGANVTGAGTLGTSVISGATGTTAAPGASREAGTTAAAGTAGATGTSATRDRDREPAPRATPGQQISLPPGTYGERRAPDGKRVGSPVFFGYGESSLGTPKIPATVPISPPLGRAKLITVGTEGGSGGSYRVLAMDTHDQPGITIVAIPPGDVDATLHRLLRDEALVAGGVLLALALLAWWIVGVGLRPLNRMGDTAGQIAAGDLSRRVSPETTRTEVGRLGIALNQMLGQIERAFANQRASEERLRRFLADASHELRTPLASIRGYAELFRMGAASDPADVSKAMSRIESEAARMGVLVQDLLTLARLDESPDLEREPVDVVALLRDARADALAQSPRREITLEGDGPLVVLGDGDRLRQVITNLIQNALVHTEDGVAIDLRATAKDGAALLEVRDHGAGLPADATELIFERLWRKEAGRGRGRAGAGLGLAIVAEIVGAHGGEVSAHNAPGGGASFVITLPLALQDSAQP
jgi:two-component system OmpR family sensor kinase